MKTKTLQKENKNFLNNQNYILGKTEKRKLLSKFFVEKYMKLYFYPGISLLNSFLVSFLKIIIIISIICLILYNFYGIIIGFIFSFLNILSILFLSFILYQIYILFKSGYFNLKVNKIENLNEFFLPPYFIAKKKKNSDFNLESFLYILLIFSLSSIIGGLIITSGPLIIGFLITVFILFFLKYNIFSFFSFILFLLSVPFSLIYFLIFKGKLGYYFLKKKPSIKFLKTFKKLKKNKAENEYYKIVEK